MADLEANAQRKSKRKSAAVISPIAIEMVRRIDAMFAIECETNGHTADQRHTARQQLRKHG